MYIKKKEGRKKKGPIGKKFIYTPDAKLWDHVLVRKRLTEELSLKFKDFIVHQGQTSQQKKPGIWPVLRLFVKKR